jgi:hypothetical protein
VGQRRYGRVTPAGASATRAAPASGSSGGRRSQQWWQAVQGARRPGRL